MTFTFIFSILNNCL